MLAHAQWERQPNLKRRKEQKRTKKRKSNVSVTSRLRWGVPKTNNYIRSNAECIGNIDSHIFWGCGNPPPIQANMLHTVEIPRLS